MGPAWGKVVMPQPFLPPAQPLRTVLDFILVAGAATVEERGRGEALNPVRYKDAGSPSNRRRNV
jgi:hypothetical protein